MTGDKKNLQSWLLQLQIIRFEEYIKDIESSKIKRYISRIIYYNYSSTKSNPNFSLSPIMKVYKLKA